MHHHPVPEDNSSFIRILQTGLNVLCIIETNSDALKFFQTVEAISHSSGHRNTTGVQHYRLLGREDADRTIATHNLSLFLSYHLDPKLLDVSVTEVLHKRIKY